MSTHSLIGYQQEDGTISSVYCHMDGYPEYQLPILTAHYNTREKAIQLVSRGGMSCLFEDINDIIFYADRGEDLRIHKSLNPADFFSGTIKAGQEYCYYIDLDGKWHYSEV